jgi:transposase
MKKLSSEPAAQSIAAFVGIDWADQKHDLVWCSATAVSQSEHRVIANHPEALSQWVAEMRQRFSPQGRIAIFLEQSRGALIYHLMHYEGLVLYPINPLQMAHYRKAIKVSGDKHDRLDAALLCQFGRLHFDSLSPWQPDDALTRKLTLLNQDRRQAIEKRTRLANELKSALKTYYPLALEVLDNDTSTLLAADLLLGWPTLEALQKQSPSKLRRFFYAHNCRAEGKLLQRLEQIKAAQPLVRDTAIIEATALKVQMLAQQLKTLLPYIAIYEKQIAQLFGSHPDSFLFSDLPGAGPALGPRLLTAFGSDRDRFSSSTEAATTFGLAPIRDLSGKRTPKKPGTVCYRHACSKFLRQSFHEFASCSIQGCSWAKAFYESQRAKGKSHHTAVRALSFKWIRILFACWKNRTPYDPHRYQLTLRQHGSPFATTLTS